MNLPLKSLLLLKKKLMMSKSRIKKMSLSLSNKFRRMTKSKLQLRMIKSSW